MLSKSTHIDIIQQTAQLLALMATQQQLSDFYHQLKIENLIFMGDRVQPSTRHSVIRIPLEIERKPHFFNRMDKVRNCFENVGLKMSEHDLMKFIQNLDRHDVLRREAVISMRSRNLVTRTP